MDEIAIELLGGALDGTAFTAVEEDGRKNFKEWLQTDDDPLKKEESLPFHVMASNEDGNRLTFLVGELNSHWWQVLQYDYKEVRCQNTVEGASWNNTHLYRYTKVYVTSDGKKTTRQAAEHLKS